MHRLQVHHFSGTSAVYEYVALFGRDEYIFLV